MSKKNFERPLKSLGSNFLSGCRFPKSRLSSFHVVTGTRLKTAILLGFCLNLDRYFVLSLKTTSTWLPLASSPLLLCPRDTNYSFNLSA